MHTESICQTSDGDVVDVLRIEGLLQNYLSTLDFKFWLQIYFLKKSAYIDEFKDKHINFEKYELYCKSWNCDPNYIFEHQHFVYMYCLIFPRLSYFGCSLKDEEVEVVVQELIKRLGLEYHELKAEYDKVLPWWG